MALKIDPTKPAAGKAWEIKDDEQGFSINGRVISPAQKARIVTQCTVRGKLNYQKMYDTVLVDFTDSWEGIIGDADGDVLPISAEVFRAMEPRLMEEILAKITGGEDVDDIAEIDPDNPTKH